MPRSTGGKGAKPRRERPKKRATPPADPAAREAKEAKIDRVLEESFPASDPPPWTLGASSRWNRARETSSSPNGAVVVRGDAGGFRQTIDAGGHALVADEPVDLGGGDAGPSPYDLLLAALGACTSMTLAAYARRKRWPLASVTVTLRHSRIHAEDCEQCETESGRLDRIEREIALDGDLDDEQRSRLLEIASRCPVHRTLASEIDLRTTLV